MTKRSKAAADPVALRWGALALGLASCWIIESGRPSAATGTAGGSSGGQLAGQGCIDGRTATLEDYRGVPGIGPRLASALVARCRGGSCRRGRPPEHVKGLGPVLAARLGPVLCQGQE